MWNKVLWMAVVVMVLVGGRPDTVEAGCFGNLSGCFRGTTTVAPFWDRFFAALDCELDFVECVRIKIIGL